MSQLTRLSNQLRRPITKLLRDAVEMFCDAKIAKQAESNVAPASKNVVAAVEPVEPANNNNRIPQSNISYLFDMVADETQPSDCD